MFVCPCWSSAVFCISSSGDETMKKLLADVIKDPGSYIMLLVFVLIVVGALYVIATSSAANWRHMYCTASEAQAIECTAKGWR
jgi:hypothetical protein